MFFFLSRKMKFAYQSNVCKCILFFFIDFVCVNWTNNKPRFLNIHVHWCGSDTVKVYLTSFLRIEIFLSTFRENFIRIKFKKFLTYHFFIKKTIEFIQLFMTRCFAIPIPIFDCFIESNHTIFQKYFFGTNLLSTTTGTFREIVHHSI